MYFYCHLFRLGVIGLNPENSETLVLQKSKRSIAAKQIAIAKDENKNMHELGVLGILRLLRLLRRN